MPAERAVKKRGFTILEILFALGIIAVMIAVMVPSLTNRIHQAQSSTLRTTLDNTLAAITAYHSNVAKYPAHLTQLTTLLAITDNDICGSSTALTTALKWRGPYMALQLGTHGLDIGDYLANDLLVRTPTSSSTPGRLDIIVPSVTSADWTALNDLVDGVSGTVPALSNSNADTAGTVQWDPATLQLKYGMIIGGC